MTILILIQVFIMILFAVIGLIFINGKGASLIAGYNSMSEAEKEKYDEVALAKFMGKMMFALIFSMIFWLLSTLLSMDWLLYVGIILFVGIVLFIVVYANTGERFKK
ncbi:DUF3784 domain-containing protein [Pseudogracilibacillus auburnensis]|uniref:DUF3784 domain-containing protein n=1 Tax=Pseudogracilibacillus auburnensis TaxID=1494959 RepID=UPI001D2DFDA0|nr:DUF3784 domain-containing protein [Pseudogracilibacillus auburnensis]MBO1002856.1 DUF3784 domain-containing protein [Pseudogracilibacillus auburnensis]